MTSLRSSEHQRAALAAGLIAGLAASFAMNLAMRTAALASFRSHPGESDAQRRFRLRQQVREWIELGDPNEDILDRTSRLSRGRPFPEQWKQAAATLTHYSFGTCLGATYAIGVEFDPRIATSSGVAVALLWWGAVNEVLLPVSGLLPPPREIPLRAHAAMLLSHVVYGITLEQTRRLFRGMLRT